MIGRMAFALPFLLLLLAPISGSELPAGPSFLQESEAVARPVPSNGEPRTDVYLAGGIGKPNEWKERLKEILVAPSKGKTISILAGARTSSDGKWMDWAQKLVPLATAERSADGGNVTVRYHNRETCECEPADGKEAARTVEKWQEEEEQLAVLRSAVTHFRSRNGKLPETVEELVRPYPDNWLPGYTSYMKEAFAELAGEKAWDEGQPQNGEKASPKAPASAGSPAKAKGLNEPLEIIIDKASHRLALVSGDVILRSYRTGLGGDRTPEGVFEITEKVRNPNGRSNGEYGSRGMTLSDPRYAVHGTDKPSSIGKDESLGCIRMLREDLEELYDLVPKGTRVTIAAGGMLSPDEPAHSVPRFRLAPQVKETNPGTRYRWLD
ncbi:L,D-transpeptidase [Paenibacillus sp. CC-CFT747]|nr:L,D-transpeptidase [Paenibacillus sp. CC-CFT747]